VLGLTAHQRFDNPPLGNNGAGVFTAGAGNDAAHGQPGYGIWNFAWYVNPSDNPSDYLGLTAELLYGPGVNEPALGKVNLGPLTGATGQDSWNLGMGFLYTPIPGVITPPANAYNPLANGDYGFVLRLKDAAGAEVARSAIVVEVGRNVPDGGSTIGLLACAGMIVVGLRSKLEVVTA
jgi:hypothetical protein